MAAREKPQLSPQQQEALSGLTGMGIPKATALDYLANVTGSTTEEILQNAIARHSAIRSGGKLPAKPAPMPDFYRVLAQEREEQAAPPGPVPDLYRVIAQEHGHCR
jgi:hypothetical protein